MQSMIDIAKFKKKQCSRCGAPLNSNKYWLCEKCRPITCPIRFKPEVDSKEIIAQKWKEIKQWYKDHPEAKAPWEEYEHNMRELAEGWKGLPEIIKEKFYEKNAGA